VSALLRPFTQGALDALAKLGLDMTPDVTLDAFKAGGKGKTTYPRDHVAAMRVPKGGSNCSNCKYVDKEAHACKSAHYRLWNGGDGKLPDYGLDEICSDWYEPTEALG
jgi:hypothetical protein